MTCFAWQQGRRNRRTRIEMSEEKTQIRTQLVLSGEPEIHFHQQESLIPHKTLNSFTEHALTAHQPHSSIFYDRNMNISNVLKHFGGGDDD